MSYGVRLFGHGVWKSLFSWALSRTLVASRPVQLSSIVDPRQGIGQIEENKNAELPIPTGRPARNRHNEAVRTETKVKTIWADYKRKHKGAIPPKKTRIRCRRGPDTVVNNACPICSRDIMIEYTDTKLLQQFISPYAGHILEATKTGLCRQQQKKMVAAVEKAWDHGVLPYPIPRKMPEEGSRIPPWNKVDIT